jgi:exodeoxyribonuclease VIII
MKEFKVGVYEDLTYEEYAEIPAFRSHDLTSVIKCPYSWKNKKDMVQTPALLEGRVQHTVFLEHHKFNDEFVIQPKIDRRTKAGKEEYEDFIALVGKRTSITQEMYDTCMERREVVKEYVPKKTDKVEHTLLFEWHSQPFKCRMDWYDGKNVWDLKTCRDASPRGFRGAINAFNYHMQAALYVDACRALDLRADGFNFLAQEKQDPYPYVVYTLTPEALKYAQARNQQALDLLIRCSADNNYKPYNLDGVQTIELSDLY